MGAYYAQLYWLVLNIKISVSYNLYPPIIISWNIEYSYPTREKHNLKNQESSLSLIFKIYLIGILNIEGSGNYSLKYYEPS